VHIFSHWTKYLTPIILLKPLLNCQRQVMVHASPGELLSPVSIISRAPYPILNIFFSTCCEIGL
jgi:hypothetical protein